MENFYRGKVDDLPITQTVSFEGIEYFIVSRVGSGGFYVLHSSSRLDEYNNLTREQKSRNPWKNYLRYLYYSGSYQFNTMSSLYKGLISGKCYVNEHEPLVQYNINYKEDLLKELYGADG